MSVRAKFKVEKIEEYNGGKSITLYPVYDSDPSSENSRFYKWTPAGHILLSTVNPAAAEQFALGKEFYIDFTPAGN